MERTSDLGKALDKVPVVAGKAHKAVYSSSGGRYWPVSHSLHLSGFATYTFHEDCLSQAVDLELKKLALV